MATGMVFRGSSDSPAATPISSVPWKEKPAIIATPTMACSPPTNGASPTVKLLKPGDSPVMIPKMVASPSPMKTMTAMTLMRANQNSLSPKPFTEKKLSANITPRNAALQ
jgi:hypothetical protein